MDDHAYVRALLDALTNQEPTGIDPDDPYGQADDGIDRYDGFGRDVVVESLAVVDGQHGAELLVTFAVVLPPDATWRSVPERGTVRLPFDREWRRLSDFSAPPAYAPVVAARVMRAAHAHVERHRAGPDRSEGRDSSPALLRTSRDGAAEVS